MSNNGPCRSGQLGPGWQPLARWVGWECGRNSLRAADSERHFGDLGRGRLTTKGSLSGRVVVDETNTASRPYWDDILLLSSRMEKLRCLLKTGEKRESQAYSKGLGKPFRNASPTVVRALGTA